jgi:putative transposase
VDFIPPRQTVEKSFIESFNGKLRDECLTLNWVESRAEARNEIDAWRREHNEA